jgi:hypothetical protein
MKNFRHYKVFDKNTRMYDVVHPVRGEICVHKISVTPRLFFIEVSVPGQESARSCICVFRHRFSFIHDINIWFWNCSNSVVFIVFILLHILSGLWLCLQHFFSAVCLALLL